MQENTPNNAHCCVDFNVSLLDRVNVPMPYCIQDTVYSFTRRRARAPLRPSATTPARMCDCTDRSSFAHVSTTQMSVALCTPVSHHLITIFRSCHSVVDFLQRDYVGVNHAQCGADVVHITTTTRSFRRQCGVLDSTQRSLVSANLYVPCHNFQLDRLSTVEAVTTRIRRRAMQHFQHTHA
jgi:hypothetical protein